MGNVLYLQCIHCGRHHAPMPGRYTCQDCGPVSGILDVVYDYSQIAARCTRESLAADRDFSMGRYRAFLPVDAGEPGVVLKVGGTPLYKADRLASRLGAIHLYVKDDGVNPTGSLKDRPSAIAVQKALEEKAAVVCCSSTGNAASSLAGCAASAGLHGVIFVPERTPQGKLAQLRMFGATVVRVLGSYEEAFRLSNRAIDRYGWYNRNAAINPYLVEGKKTVSFEIAEQMRWDAPDWVISSVGDGCTIAGVWKGFEELHRTGFIQRSPRIAGVQAQGCAPLTKAFFTEKDVEPVLPDTIADSIAVGTPRNAVKALRAVRTSRGTFVNVSDEEILSAMRLLGETTGVFGEPSGVACIAGLKKLLHDGIIGRDETVVCIVTGNGLKDVGTALRAAEASDALLDAEPDGGDLFTLLERAPGITG
jgi:threonine synthase